MIDEDSIRRVLVIGAHPDDPEFGCAATVAKWAAMGRQVDYLLLTSGDKGSHDPALHPGTVAAQREEEQRAAARELGVHDITFLHYPDGILENTLELRRQVCNWLRRLKPDTVVAIDPWRRYQLHPDHRVAGIVALDAIYAAREWYIFPEQLLGEEPWRVHNIFLFWTENADYWEDVSTSIDRRIAALRKHDSQVNGQIDAIAEHIRAAAQETGKAQGYAYAEAFKYIRL